MSSPFPKREGVMLAHPITTPKLSKLGQLFFAQPKLNGERCRVDWFRNYPVLISSYGNEFPCIPHINAAISALTKEYGPQVPWDGELYLHGMPREEIHSIVSRRQNPHPDAEKIQLHIFDHQDPNLFQYQRLVQVQEFIPSNHPIIKRVETSQCAPDLWLNYLSTYTDQGYEGIILRHTTALYEDKRSPFLLKYKPSEKDHYRILDLQEALDIHTKEPKNMVGAYIVCGDDLTPFKVGAGKVPHSLRTSQWEDRHHPINTPIGKLLEVKHEKLRTINKIPVSCVAIRVLY